MDESKVPVGNTNRYLRLIHRHRLVVTPGTNVKVTTRYLWRTLGIGWWYLRLIHRSHPPQKYRYQDEPVPILALVPVHLHSGTFGVDLWRVFY